MKSGSITFGASLFNKDARYENPKRYPINLLDDIQMEELGKMAKTVGKSKDIIVLSSLTEESPFQNFHKIYAEYIPHNPKDFKGTVQLFTEKVHSLTTVILKCEIFKLAKEAIEALRIK